MTSVAKVMRLIDKFNKASENESDVFFLHEEHVRKIVSGGEDFRSLLRYVLTRKEFMDDNFPDHRFSEVTRNKRIQDLDELFSTRYNNRNHVAIHGVIED